MNNDIESELSRLPEPMPPAALMAVVMARVEREHDAQRSAPPTQATRGVLDRFAWLAVFGGGVIVSVSWMNIGHEGASMLALMAQMRVPNQAGLPFVTPAAAGLVVGLLLYVAGLLLPRRRGGHHIRRSAM